MACLLFHKWDGCKCVRCGNERDEQHDYDKCAGICRRCGRRVAENHSWDGCVCAVCGRSRNASHELSGCKCVKCGTLRNREHDWDGCTCKVCGTTREEGHVLKACRCVRCGSVKHTWVTDACSVCGIGLVDYCMAGTLSEKERQEVLSCVTQQSTFEGLLTAMYGKYGWYQEYRRIVKKWITDDNILERIAMNAAYEHDLRAVAANKVSDLARRQKVLQQMPGRSVSEQAMVDMDIRSGM